MRIEPDASAIGAIDPAAVLRVLPDPVVVIDAAANLLWCNPATEERFGWSLDEWRGRPVSDLVHPEDMVTAITALHSVQAKAVGTSIEIRFRDRRDHYHHFEVRGRGATEVAGVGGVVLVLRDVTERRRWEVAAGDSVLLQAIVDNAPGITMLLDRDGTLRGASRAFSHVLGRDLEDSLGRRLGDLASGEAGHAVDAELGLVADGAPSHTFDATFEREGAAPVPLRITAVNLLDDQAVRGIVATAIDITALVDAHQRLRHLANHDQLTGLANRALLIERVDHGLSSVQGRRSDISIIFCDLDGLKAINDRFGHAAGDAVLIEVGRRLLGTIRAGDSVGRIGGDEFVVVMEDASADVAAGILERLEAAMDDPVTLPGGAQLRVAVSAGVATDAGEASASEMLARADGEMYRVKRERQHARSIIPA